MKVSIITPTYNHEKFIKDCIESVLAQTYQNWEMIIVDDASSDRTPEIIKNYAEKEKRIKFIRHKENYGPYKLADTYNEALDISQGELIAILEGDDFWPKDKLKRQVKTFSDPNVVMSYGKAIEVGPRGRIIKIWDNFRKRNKEMRNDPIGSFLKIASELKVPTCSVSVMIKASVLKKIGGFVKKDYLPLVDYPTYLKLALEGKFEIVNDQILGYWRRHKNSICINYNKLAEIWEGFSRCFLEFLEEEKNRLKSLGIRFDLNLVKKKHQKIIKSFREKWYLSQGKYCIYFNDWDLAKKYYLESFRKSENLVYRTMGLIGWCCALLKIDILEPFVWIKRKMGW